MKPEYLSSDDCHARKGGHPDGWTAIAVAQRN
jgi:hypothetical protein